ncbi:hypothetical protein [Thiomicrorhabdus indica]|uniref:hypothetical protein n=1 Tax=Thiomicrorhabdus indica TaxID=2267253 RepID=UPI00102DC3F8|nr:hypothetical protein [Thiomicrorhabdus indica]
MLKIVTNVKSGEEDILTPVKNENLRVFDLDGNLICEVKNPIFGWTTELLWQQSERLYRNGLTKNGADAFLGRSWIGSTEV